jgi:hypothetical protein
MGVAAEKEVKFTSFSGHKMTIRMRAMRRRRALVYSDSVMAAMERGPWGQIVPRDRQSLV